MRRKQSFWVALVAICLLGTISPAMADWGDVTNKFSISTSAPVANTNVDGTFTTIDVTVTFSADLDDAIMGDLRLLVVPLDGTPAPRNPDGEMGLDGSNPIIYYILPTGEDGELVPNESVTITMEMEGNVSSPDFNFSIEVNDESIDTTIFRKKISKTPEYYSGEGGIEVMPLYVEARSTQGYAYTRDTLSGDLIPCCPDECPNGEEGADDVCGICDPSCAASGYATVKPLVVTYVQEEEEAPFNSVPSYDPNEDGVADEGDRYAHDIYAAVSYDEGLTWKRRNISRTSLKSSFTLPNGVSYPGDSEDADLTVVGPYAFVTWVDKYCRSGDPWDMEAQDIDDIYQVTGSQKSVDYLDVTGDEDPRPDLGVRPFSCLWGARGVLDMEPETADGEANPNYGTIVWYKAEQLSTGRRDAKRNFNAGIEPVHDPNLNENNLVEGTGGFAVSWQEDPKGLKTGKGRGPGAGMSGACVNHKTDIWYSYIGWSDFATVDEDFVSNSDGDAVQDGDGESMSNYFCTACPYVYDPELGDVEHDILAGTSFDSLPEDWVCPLCGAAKADFEKDAKPHALVHFHPPVRVTDNAVCRERNPTEIMGHVHTADHIAVTDCDYYYEGGTTNQPLAWDDLPDDWACPKCGGTKDTFEAEAIFIKYRNEGAPYCEWFANNPRVDGDGNEVSSTEDAYAVAYYTTDEGEPLDGNTGASRANLSLVNWQGETLALMAYEETKGVGAGSDKEAAAMEQAAPLPLVKMDDGTWEAGFTNSDCRSCHYKNVVPRDRVIPVSDQTICEEVKGGVWKEELEAYFPYTGYPYITDQSVDVGQLAADGVSYDTSNAVKCVKFQGGWGMYPRDYAQIYEGDNYYNLPDHMPGWHQEALDCTGCHLPYNTKDSDGDTINDRADMCPGTPAGADDIDMNPESVNYGCSASESPDDQDNNKDEPDRFRHGKNLYYHHFVFNDPDLAAIGHGDQINGFSRDVLGQDDEGNDILWSAPDTYDPYENARRVRVVPNDELDEESTNGITLGLLYKEGKDGQGAPADAILRLFRGGFDVADMDPEPLNLSSSTPYLFQNPDDAGSEDGSGDNPAGDGTGDMLPNRNTPKIDHFYWTDANLHDPTGYWYKSEAGDNLFDEDGYTPDISGNPFENVFSTRLAIHGDLVLAGYAYCVNWSAGKKAKDHYDFYIRVSEDAGAKWTLPVNVSQLKNHEESVADCRVILTPPTLDDWAIYDSPYGQRIPFSMTGAPAIESPGDFNEPNTFFVGVGTKENIPQPSPNVTELEESEVFLDTFYSQAKITNGVIEFETYQKDNPKYIEGSKPYLDVDGNPTDDACAEILDDDTGTCVPNEPNPAFPELVDEFNWLAKGDANQGDIQMTCNPFGSRLYTIWEQELPITDEDGQKHFQGSDVWFRKIIYEEPEASESGDVNGDGDLTWDDGRAILDAVGTTAYDADFLWAGDYDGDYRISGRDYSRWKRLYTKDSLGNKRKKWRSK